MTVVILGTDNYTWSYLDDVDIIRLTVSLMFVTLPGSNIHIFVSLRSSTIVAVRPQRLRSTRKTDEIAQLL